MSRPKIRVLVADDSAFMRKVLTDIVNSDEGLEVVATARNGQDALQKALCMEPDVITLDVEMPLMDGIRTLEKIMEVKPVPVIMLSALTQEGALSTLAALEKGAVDFIAKPGGSISLEIGKVKEEIIDKIKTSANISPARIKNTLKKFQLPFYSPNYEILKEERKCSFSDHDYSMVAIGTSTGGPKALHQVMSGLERGLNAAFFIVQHMPPGFTKSLAQRLDSISPLIVKEAEDGELVEKGTAYVAPGDYHMEVIGQRKDLYIRLTQNPQVNGHRPAVDTMMYSLSKLSLPKVGVIMTGMGSDGALGIKALKDVGAVTVGQNSETCVVYGMPKSAVQLGVVDFEVPLHHIAGYIMKALRN